MCRILVDSTALTVVCGVRCVGVGVGELSMVGMVVATGQYPHGVS